MVESDLQKAVIGRAQFLGWKVMHPLPGKTGKGWATSTQGDGKGYPDLTLVRERMMFVELKAEGKYLSVEQKLWRDWIIAAGGEWYCWKPLQWFDKSIDMILGVKYPTVSVARDVQDQTKLDRLVKACGGDVEQARRVYDSLP
jgi:hypothetical protein